METKTIKVPDSWKEISLRTFQEINNVNDNEWRAFETIAILIDQDPEEIKAWDRQSFNRVSEALSWALKMPDSKFERIIEIDGIEYGFCPKLSSLSNGNWMDIEYYLADSINNIHKLMAIFYRPILIKKDDEYMIEPYDTDTSSKRAELFLDKMNISDCYGSLLFFSTIGRDCIVSIQDYFLKEIKRMKKKQSWISKLGLKRIRGWRNGRGSTSSTLWQKAT